MEEENQTANDQKAIEQVEHTSGWREVGEQLQELGAKLAAAFRAAWSEERSAENEEAVRSLQQNLREAADRLERVVKRVASETEAEREATIQATRGASEQSLAEARIATASGLKTLNQQIDALVNRLEQQKAESQESSEVTEGSEPNADSSEEREG